MQSRGGGGGGGLTLSSRDPNDNLGVYVGTRPQHTGVGDPFVLKGFAFCTLSGRDPPGPSWVAAHFGSRPHRLRTPDGTVVKGCFVSRPIVNTEHVSHFDLYQIRMTAELSESVACTSKR